MKRFSGFLFMILVLLAAASPARSESYFLYDQYGGTWQDANKTAANTEDDLMCWAAAASNVLAWGKWVTSAYNTGPAIFQYFTEHWTDNAGYMYWAYNWWLNGTPPPTTAYSYPDVPGGNFFPTHSAGNYVTNVWSGNMMSSADSLLHSGKGVTMTIRNSRGGAHAVTLWGFSYSAPGAYTSAFITDSDDGYYGLREYSLIYQNDTWYLGDYFGGGWYISDLEAMGLYSDSGTSDTPTKPAKKPKPLKPAKGEVVATPIAPTWALFGTGMLSLYLMRRRRRRGTSKKVHPL